MSIFKCKMCGGTIEFEQGATVGTCDSCGTRQTLPRLDDERKANLYDRANHFRRNNDFDKAMGIYEQVLNEDSTDAEAYWSLVLCRYGIEYVEDPATHKRIPTVNRAQFTSIYMDEDYKSALQYADTYQKTIYEAEAKAIDDIQKGILEISAKEEPFDVFICYKETDANGRRTQDSVLANDLYHQLTQEGFKVFFSRITLEDKLGVAYEPYIFAALNSAKVMVALGTKPEYFNAVWVKNEWSRYLALIKNGAKKILIPAYRDMDPYDLPEEFSHLQAQDMSKLGFMQDLIRGIKKIACADATAAAVSARETVAATPVNTENVNIAPLLERAFLFLEDSKWQDADAYCEKVLDIDPKNALAYLGKLMAETESENREILAYCSEPFDQSDNFRKVIRFGDEAIVAEVRGYNNEIKERNEKNRCERIYDNATKAMNSANTEDAYKVVVQIFRTIKGYQDADSLAEQCLEKAEICRKDAIYEAAHAVFGENSCWRGKDYNISPYEEAIQKFKSISGWRDADEQVQACLNKIEEIKAQKEADRLAVEKARIEAVKREKKLRKAIGICIGIICIGCVALFVVKTTIIPNNKYDEAMRLYNEGNWTAAEAQFQELSGYKDSEVMAKQARYNYAEELFVEGLYESALTSFQEIEEFSDSATRIAELEEKIEEVENQKVYDRAKELEKHEGIDIKTASTLYRSISGYLDSEEKAKECLYNYAMWLYKEKKYKDAENAFSQCQDYSDSEEMMKKAKQLYIQNLENTVDNMKMLCKQKDDAMSIKRAKEIFHALNPFEGIKHSMTYEQLKTLYKGHTVMKDEKNGYFTVDVYNVSGWGVTGTLYVFYESSDYSLISDACFYADGHGFSSIFYSCEDVVLTKTKLGLDYKDSDGNVYNGSLNTDVFYYPKGSELEKNLN